MPLFFVCDSKLKQQADNMKVDKLQLNVRVISKCNNQQIAVLKNAKFEKFRIEEICSKVYGTFSPKHPSIESLLAKGEYILSG